MNSRSVSWKAFLKRLSPSWADPEAAHELESSATDSDPAIRTASVTLAVEDVNGEAAWSHDGRDVHELSTEGGVIVPQV